MRLEVYMGVWLFRFFHFFMLFFLRFCTRSAETLHATCFVSFICRVLGLEVNSFTEVICYH
jgi:hypothetical protein